MASSDVSTAPVKTVVETVVAALEELASKISSLDIQEGDGLKEDPKAPHRSHDPQHNQKKPDVPQFGSRYLNESDDVFEFNAWDHVETDDTYKEYSEKQYAMQRQSPVSPFEKNKFNSTPAKWWDLFYKNNTANFFKNRKWLLQEFPILEKATQEDAGPMTIMEIGAGAGNSAFPILALNKNPALKIHALDFSKKAVDVMRSHAEYDPNFIQVDVWDVAGDCLPPDLEEGSVDVALMVFVFSALSPKEWAKAVGNVYRLLKPGGEVCFRDYGRGDLAQVRFKKERYLEENFYLRGDGTRVYFFDKDELEAIWMGKNSEDSEQSDEDTLSFTIESLGVDRRLLVNRAKRITMYRCWLQGRFKRK